MRIQTFAHLTLPQDKDDNLNEDATILDGQSVCIGSTVFTCDRVFMPMSLKSLFVESGLSSSLQHSDAAIIYYGEDSARKKIGEFVFQCGKAIAGQNSKLRLNAYGFYCDTGVCLTASEVQGHAELNKLLQVVIPEHNHHARKARGRSHAVFRFAANRSLSVVAVDGLPNTLRAPDPHYRLTTRTDDLVSMMDRPELPQCVLNTVDRILDKDAPVYVIAHCPLAHTYRYALADALMFIRELKALDQ